MNGKHFKVLLLENIHPDAAASFRRQGFSVRLLKKALPEAELARALKGVSVLGVRSKTKLTESVLRRSRSLIAVGCFCVGTQNVDLRAAADRGVAVFNAPFSNTRSVAELVIGEIIMLRRRVFERSGELHAGTWLKSSAHSHEVRGKRLGIVGYGKIGAQVGILAEAMGMEVHYCDLLERLSLGNARPCRSLRELLRRSDFVTLHVDDRPANVGLVGRREIAAMRPGSFLLNLSRGKVVDLRALADALRSGRLLGAAVDVFPKEPAVSKAKFRTALSGLSNVIMTPHIGGSTVEAQRDIAGYVTEKLSRFVLVGDTLYSVNFPQVHLPVIRKYHRLLHVHRNVPGIMSQITTLLAGRKINITGQYLETNERIGYAITDIAGKYDPRVLRELEAIPETVRLRRLY